MMARDGADLDLTRKRRCVRLPQGGHMATGYKRVDDVNDAPTGATV
jgi:hypothetical protein